MNPNWFIGNHHLIPFDNGVSITNGSDFIQVWEDSIDQLTRIHFVVKRMDQYSNRTWILSSTSPSAVHMYARVLAVQVGTLIGTHLNAIN